MVDRHGKGVRRRSVPVARAGVRLRVGAAAREKGQGGQRRQGGAYVHLGLLAVSFGRDIPVEAREG
jgi:hypothetical protein